MKLRIVSLLVSFGLLAVLIYFSGVKEVIDIIVNANPFFILLGISLYFFDIILRTLRWKYLLNKVNINLSFYKVMKIFIPSMFFSNLSPGKVAEPIRNILLKKTEGKSIGVSLPSLFYERAVDVFIMSAISIIGLFLFASYVKITWITLSVSFYLLIFGVGIFILFSKNRTEKTLVKLFSLMSFSKRIKKYKKKIIIFSSSIHESFIKYNNKQTILIMFLYTTLIWILSGVLLFISFKTLGIEVSLVSTITIVPMASLVGVLTFLPGGIGSSEAIVAIFFTSLFSISLSQVVAAALLVRIYYFLIYGLPTPFILGAFKYKYRI